MAKGLTKKQKGFVRDYLETDNATEAAERNYDVKNRNVANNIGAENLAKPSIIKTIADMLPDDLLAEKHLALLNKLDSEGEIDVQAVKAGVDMGYKVKGSYAPDKNININIQQQTEEQMIKGKLFTEWLKNQIA